MNLWWHPRSPWPRNSSLFNLLFPAAGSLLWVSSLWIGEVFILIRFLMLVWLGYFVTESVNSRGCLNIDNSGPPNHTWFLGKLIRIFYFQCCPSSGGTVTGNKATIQNPFQPPPLTALAQHVQYSNGQPQVAALENFSHQDLSFRPLLIQGVHILHRCN